MRKIVSVLIVLSVFAAVVFAGGEQEKATGTAAEERKDFREICR